MVAVMTDAAARAEAFRALHRPGEPLLIPNPWDVGSARLLVHLGFQALATTSSGFAATLGRLDGDTSRDEALSSAAAIAAAVPVPVSADLENGFADEPEGVADTVARACQVGLAGLSIEDTNRHRDEPIYELELAVARVEAAVEAIRAAAEPVLLTARADGFLHGRADLADAITRLQAYQEAGADVLYAPGIRDIESIRTLVSEVDRPVNGLIGPGSPTVAEMAEAGIARISVGGGFAYAALGGLVDAATELSEQGTAGYWAQADKGRQAVRQAFGS